MTTASGLGLAGALQLIFFSRDATRQTRCGNGLEAQLLFGVSGTRPLLHDPLLLLSFAMILTCDGDSVAGGVSSGRDSISVYHTTSHGDKYTGSRLQCSEVGVFRGRGNCNKARQLVDMPRGGDINLPMKGQTRCYPPAAHGMSLGAWPWKIC
ncbi:hypothetical protein FB45DRAFT_957081 [Roridomyces roridus]|uniref:Uncharacterized protein n=1 Tax=Roridomyces roridus TaxID=1738132 RepID=A0AAD7AYP3_9AGAR|nr:hypothetical protein FB45DRAFT_957081 [Roridomyces roridus]